LPQYRHYRPVSSVDARQAVIWIFYGYFMKVLVADSIAPLTDLGFGPQTSGIWVILGTLAFGLQIYADFCGYSYIARGLALLFGIDIMSNFNRQYWSTSIQEFWYRWHISLSQWLRDYLYIPLGGNRKGTKRTYLNLLLTMLLGGLWHGASWTFVLWGGWHGIMLIINKLWVQHISLRLYDIFGWLLTFTGVMISWFLFRAQSFEQVNFLVSALLRDLTWLPGHTEGIKMIAILSCPIFIIEWLQSKDLSRIKYIKSFCWIISGVAAALAFAALARVRLDFIYFQF
jgi:alginate O-acetyltransferase complex protein AlgI